MDNDKKLTLILTKGVPACGKSTWAKEYVQSHKNFIIVNRDSIRTMLRGVPDFKTVEELTTDIEDATVKNAFKRGYSVIVDATNLNPKYLGRWYDMAADFHAEVKVKEFVVSYKEAVRRDFKRKKEGGVAVGAAIIKGFFERYYPEQLAAELERGEVPEQEFEAPRYMLPIDEDKEPCYCFDLDGTLAIHNQRGPFDYKKIPTDILNERLAKIVNALSIHGKIIFLSGREATEVSEKNTLEWLRKNFPNLKVEKAETVNDLKARSHASLLMRKEKDGRSDDIVKKEIYDNFIKDNFDVIGIFDDRDKVVRMWRKEGLLCNQVYYGDF